MQFFLLQRMAIGSVCTHLKCCFGIVLSLIDVLVFCAENVCVFLCVFSTLYIKHWGDNVLYK